MKMPESWPFEDLLSLSTMTLATSGEPGPHAAAVYFASDAKLRLYYFSDEKSRHSMDIAQNPRVAAAIYPHCTGWQDIRGLQIQGKAGKIESGEAWNCVWDLYREKFPFVKSLKAVIARNELYMLVPHWIRYVDNAIRFGYKQEWDLSGDDA